MRMYTTIEEMHSVISVILRYKRQQWRTVFPLVPFSNSSGLVSRWIHKSLRSLSEGCSEIKPLWTFPICFFGCHHASDVNCSLKAWFKLLSICYKPPNMTIHLKAVEKYLPCGTVNCAMLSFTWTFGSVYVFSCGLLHADKAILA